MHRIASNNTNTNNKYLEREYNKNDICKREKERKEDLILLSFLFDFLR